MHRVTILAFLTAAALGNANRAVEKKEKDDIQMSVGPKNFQLSSEEAAGAENSALAQLRENLRSKPEERPENAALSEAQSVAREVSQASAGMSQLRDHSAELRGEVAELTAELGLDESAAKGRDTEKEKEEAKAKLHELAQERARVQQMADNLDRQMHEQYASLLGDEVQKTASLLSVSESENDDNRQNAEDKMFAELEKQTDNILHWFQQLKELRQQRDHMKSQRQAALQQAETVGLSNQEVQQELTNSQKSSSQLQAGQTDQKLHQKQQLANVMASSAMEMAQIESASNDVMHALDELTNWKESHDSSPASMAQAAKVKAKLDKALKFLAQHESTVATRTDQINALMRDAGMGHL